MKLEEGIPLSGQCWYRIGGKASYYARPQSIEDMQQLLDWSHREGQPTFLLGYGSNVLFDDAGFEGLVIHTKSLKGYEQHERGIIEAAAGQNLESLVGEVNDLGLQGLESFVGIPGSIGGAVYGNAGASGGGIGDLVSEVELIEPGGIREWCDGRDLDWRYRESGIGDRVVARVRIRLQPDVDPETLRKESARLLEKKIDTQPFDIRTCGCIFKNPTGMSAGRMIDECGLPDLQIGGARISKIHANFIENVDGKATSDDIERLIDRMREEVRDQHDVELDLEVVLAGTREERTR
ncbi:MAG TPA: UDP-N-acetylmuramate dehydrogenase [Planctomycetes bacterium]|nr:UDP-N-acetylmuramate dehydrogenase [Planctomycetota bacterium]